MKLIHITFAFSLVIAVASENILIVHSFWVGSHLFTLRTLSDIFVEMGHTVKIVRYLDVGSPGALNKKGISETILSLNNSDGRIPLVTKEEEGRFHVPMKHLWKNGLNLIKMLPTEGFTTVQMICDDMLKRKSLIDQLKQSNFSVALVDITYNECGMVFAHNLGLPILGYIPHDLTMGPILYTAAFMPTSITPQTYSGFPDNMNFPQRVLNTLRAIFIHILMQIQSYKIGHIAQTHFPGTPSVLELYRDMIGLYYDTHPAFEYPRPLPPTFAQIGGVHLGQAKPLSNDLEEFVQSSGKNGFILFSLGLTFDPMYIPTDKYQEYFTAFSKLSQKVLVRAAHIPPDVPDNVKVLSSLPQQDLLGHPKIVLFVGHGGIKGIMEAMHFGVPMVGIPIFSDQMDNVLRLERLGAAKVVSKEDNGQTFVDAIKMVIANPKYKEASQNLSVIMKAHENPKTKTVNLMKLILESKGADHLKIGGRKLNIFQYLCLDIAIFLLCMFSISIILTLYFVKYFSDILRWVFRNTKFPKLKYA